MKRNQVVQKIPVVQRILNQFYRITKSPRTRGSAGYRNTQTSHLECYGAAIGKTDRQMLQQRIAADRVVRPDEVYVDREILRQLMEEVDFIMVGAGG